MFEHQTIDQSYGFDIKKFDACKKEFSSVWATPGYLPNEPLFIANPNGNSEDDGIILTVAFDFLND
jgi:torulene dioxygenase